MGDLEGRLSGSWRCWAGKIIVLSYCAKNKTNGGVAIPTSKSMLELYIRQVNRAAVSINRTSPNWRLQILGIGYSGVGSGSSQ